MMTQPAPSYCLGRSLLSKPLTPAQWTTCWNYGWHEPTPGWLTRVAYDFGHNVAPALIILAIGFFAVLALMMRR
jgi:hypothetical protein